MICTTGSSTTTLSQQGRDSWQFLEQDWMLITAVIDPIPAARSLISAKQSTTD
ncbi:hypothetical protein H6G65_18570 [Microcystis elabens FACHB-917]|nr:hypothetical protein [Microcystis elabens FACHB-917]